MHGEDLLIAWLGCKSAAGDWESSRSYLSSFYSFGNGAFNLTEV